MSDKFLGVGLARAIALALFVILVIVVLKVIFTKWQLPGITEIIHAV